MKLFLAIAMVLFASGAFSQESLVKRRQDEWMKCLRASYAIQSKETRDKNLAAERSFQSCSTEEDALRAQSIGVPASSFASLKSATKQMIIEGK